MIKTDLYVVIFTQGHFMSFHANTDLTVPFQSVSFLQLANLWTIYYNKILFIMHFPSHRIICMWAIIQNNKTYSNPERPTYARVGFFQHH